MFVDNRQQRGNGRGMVLTKSSTCIFDKGHQTRSKRSTYIFDIKLWGAVNIYIWHQVMGGQSTYIYDIKLWGTVNIYDIKLWGTVNIHIWHQVMGGQSTYIYDIKLWGDSQHIYKTSSYGGTVNIYLYDIKLWGTVNIYIWHQIMGGQSTYI